MYNANRCLVLALTLAGCGGAPFLWVKSGATQSDFDRDMARCKYEAASSTANYNTGRTAGTLSGAMAQGIGEGMAIGSKQVELIQLCLQAQGYTKQPIDNGSATPYTPSATTVAVVRPVEPVTPVAVKTAKAADSVVTADAETAKVIQVLTDTRFPLVGNPIRFKQKGALTFYEARGAGAALTQVVCEAGACRLRTGYE